jgi:hypothetical protein
MSLHNELTIEKTVWDDLPDSKNLKQKDEIEARAKQGTLIVKEGTRKYPGRSPRSRLATGTIVQELTPLSAAMGHECAARRKRSLSACPSPASGNCVARIRSS